MINVALMNGSTVVRDPQLGPVRQALQIQLDAHFTPAWSIQAEVQVLPFGDPPAGYWSLCIFDNTDQADVAGRHDVTSTGLPEAYVYANTAQSMGLAWSGVASHELLEMLVDPNCQLMVYSPQRYNGYLFAYEICDPCEERTYTIALGGQAPIDVSDFVYPAWFAPLTSIGSTPFDQLGLIQAPFQLLPGCHMDVLDVCAARWRTFWGEGQPTRYAMLQAIEPRQALRRKPRALWRRSEVMAEGRAEVAAAPSSTAEALDEALERVQRLTSSLQRFEGGPAPGRMGVQRHR